ncbi:RHS repeat-associated core domain-containing protein [Streptomyces liangshanensis]|uniref:RHS repeat-associated core domain-containing protein n=1 Tax=Streptomyces liangshanensis TaxID=2717324 RepID=UPI0036DE2CF8
MALLVQGVAASDLALAQGTHDYRVVPGKEHSVPVATVGHRDVKRPAMPPWNAKAVKDTWPAAGAADATLSVTTSAIGKLPLSARALPSSSTSKPAAAAVGSPRIHAEIREKGLAAKLGVHGVVAQISRADGYVAATHTSDTPTLAGAGSDKARISLSYASFRDAYGGDWASRLRMVSLPACALTTPQESKCQIQTPLASENDPVANDVSADVDLRQGSTAHPLVLAAVAATAGGGGSFAATSLSPSGQWNAGGSSGGFSWSYPIAVPDVPGGLTPSISLDYNSQTVDGRTSSTNGQSSWIGDGWDYSPGFVERTYASCADDAAGGSPKTSDQCWSDDVDSLTLSLNGSSNTLVHDDATNSWHTQGDNGERVEIRTTTVNDDNDHEYFVVTTADDTTYYFGLDRLPGWTTGNATTKSVWTTPVYGNDTGEPCHAATFAASRCQQAYRWNLDYVVDSHDDAISYWYAPETGYYGPNGTTTPTAYTRAGNLSKIQYGQRAGKVYDTTTPAAGQVFFDTAERCLPNAAFDCASNKLTTANASHWPDVPFDQNCDSTGTCNSHGPSFWSTKRLTGIRTQALVGSAYQDVDAWTLTHTLPATGDTTTPALWLSSIARTGKVGGSAALPPVKFAGQALANRVDGLDGYQPLTRYRMTTITTESGEVITVNYTAPQCHRTGTAVLPSTQDGNKLLCYPSYWTPPGQTSPQLDYFNKFLVHSVTEQDPSGGGLPVQTSYSYLGDPAWHYNDDPLTPAKYRTWNQWRGYGQVETRTGTAPEKLTLTRTTYFRGMDGDKTADGTRSITLSDRTGDESVRDSDWLTGQVLESLAFNGDGGALLSDSVSIPWVGPVTASQSRTKAGLDTPLTARRLNTARTKSITTKADGSSRTTETDYTFDAKTGQPTTVDDRGDLATSADDRCTRTIYAQDASGAWLTLPREVRTVAVSCEAAPVYPKDLISDDLSFFDNATDVTTPPVKGDVTMVQKADSVNASGVAHHITATRTSYDQYGRPVTETDADGRVTTTAYTPLTGAAPTSITVTAPKVTGQAAAFAATTTYDPARGLSLKSTDAAGLSTTNTYDPLGRLTAVWKPGFAITGPANTKFGYNLSNTVPSTVTTQTLQDNSTYRTSITLYDAMLRQRETQTATVDGGRTITDAVYDSHGWQVKASDPYYNAGSPTSTLVAAPDNQTPSQSATVYDGAGRATASIAYTFASETWRTATAYVGSDRTDVTPPLGATPTSTVVDARGQTVKLLRYHGATAAGAADTVTYSYDASGHQTGQDDGAGRIWSSTYDLLGRQTAQDDPDTGHSTSGYDLAGQLLWGKDARGKTVNFTYDEMGRTTATYDTTGGVAPSTGNELTSFSYDTLKKGMPTSSTRYSGGAAYVSKVMGYDSHGWPQATALVIPATAENGALAGTYLQQSHYNLTGTLDTLTDTAAGSLPQETLAYTYDTFGRPTGVGGNPGWRYVDKLSYTEFDEPQQFNFGTSGNFTQQTLQYDDQTRRLTSSLTVSGSGTKIADKTSYAYQPSGNITKISDLLEDGATDTQCFAYDWAQRLSLGWTATDACATPPSAGASSTVGGPAPYWQSWSYDKGGERSTQVNHDTTGATAHDATTTYADWAPGEGPAHALASATTVVPADPTKNTVNNYTYDGAGNIATRTARTGTDTFSYNTEGSLAELSSTSTSGDTTYLYDAGGNLLIRRGPSDTVLFTADEEITLTHGDTTASGVRNISLAGRTVATEASNGKIAYVIPDRQGTGDLQIDSQTQAITRRQYTPFGETRTAASAWTGAQGYVGGQQDNNTGLTNLGAREYDPTVGRFLSPDPLFVAGDPESWNAYAYSDNNPTTLSDPSGQMACASPIECGGGAQYGNNTPSKNSGGKPLNDPSWGCSGCDGNSYDDGWYEKSGWSDAKGVHLSAGSSSGKSSSGGKTISNATAIHNAEVAAQARQKATANAVLAAATAEKEGFTHQLVNLVADLIGVTDALNCFTKGDVMGCINTGLNAVPWGKAFEALKVGYKAFKIFRALDKAETAVKDAGELSRAADEAYEAAISCTLHSFTATTAVQLADGDAKPISQVKVGDTVEATDPQTGVNAPEKVQRVIVTTTDEDFTDLTLSGPHDEAVTLTTTWHHPFWDVTSHRWINAKDLTTGAKLHNLDGSSTAVLRVRNYHHHTTTYDLSVSRIHSYYVLAGATPVLVHNCGPDDAVTLYRFGSGPETTEALAKDAAFAASKDFPHGISTSKRLPPKIKESGEYRSATVGELREKGFEVEQTGNNKAHHTVHLPNPVTDDVTNSLNGVFGGPG